MAKHSKVLFLLCFLSVSSFAQKLRYDRPADFFEEALVIGNGTMGGIVYGQPDTERISLNDITLWTGEPCYNKVESPEAYKSLPALRKALSENDYREADRIQHDIQGHFSQKYQPLGEMLIQFLEPEGPVTNYQRWLDIGNATAHTTYQRGAYRYETEYFATCPDSGMVIRITTSNPRGVKALLSLSCQLRSNIRVQEGRIVNDGYAPYASLATELPSFKDSKEKFSYDENRGIHFRTVIATSASNVSPQGNKLLVEGGREVLVYVTNSTSFSGFDRDPVRQGLPYREIADRRMSNLKSLSYKKLLRRHISDYQNLYNRVKLTLGDPSSQPDEEKTTDVLLREYVDENLFSPQLETLYFQYGRYLLISCSRTPGVPANLQGLWNERILPPWSCNYTCNINLEENYWHAETGALPEMHNSLFTYLRNLSVSGHNTAKAYYGVNRGWCMGHNSDPWAMTCPVGLHIGDPCWANWNMGGAWLSTHIWEHYSFSLDKDFLRQYYPVLKGAAEFCIDWLVPSSSLGVPGTEYLLTAPSTSPENCYHTPDGYDGRTCFGGFADIAMIRECLSDAVSAASELGTDADFVRQARATLQRLQPYKIGHQGNLQEWFYDWNDVDPHHRHQSHLVSVYPGHHLEDGLHSADEIRQAAARTLEIKGDQTTGWSAGWRVNLFARLHNSKGAYHIFRKLLNYISPDGYQGADARRGGGTYPNLLDAHSPFQIDGNFGGCAGVMEMLVQSNYSVSPEGQSSTTLELLPALPEYWSSGHLSGVRARGGLSVDMQWADSRVSRLVLTAQAPCSINLQANGTVQTLRLKKGKNKIHL